MATRAQNWAALALPSVLVLTGCQPSQDAAYRRAAAESPDFVRHFDQCAQVALDFAAWGGVIPGQGATSHLNDQALDLARLEDAALRCREASGIVWEGDGLWECGSKLNGLAGVVRDVSHASKKRVSILMNGGPSTYGAQYGGEIQRALESALSIRESATEVLKRRPCVPSPPMAKRSSAERMPGPTEPVEPVLPAPASRLDDGGAGVIPSEHADRVLAEPQRPDVLEGQGGYSGTQGNHAPAPIVVAPSLRTSPTLSEISRAYPPGAERLRADGVASIRCRVIATGQLTACQVIHEAPEGLGFGQSALSLAPAFTFFPQTVNGAATSGGWAEIPVEWAGNQ